MLKYLSLPLPPYVLGFVHFSQSLVYFFPWTNSLPCSLKQSGQISPAMTMVRFAPECV